MARFVALLRGINLGSSNKIAMPRLRELAEGLGYANVRTYINSGNLLFEARGGKGVDLRYAKAIGGAITEQLGLSIDVAVRTDAELAAAVEANPYPDGDPKQVQVTFLMGPAAGDAEQKIAALATDVEHYTVGPREIYVDYGGGLAKSKLALSFSKVVGVSATSRNIRTCQTLTSMMGE